MTDEKEAVEMAGTDKFERLLKAVESIADSLGYLAPISESLESLSHSVYEMNEKLEAMTGPLEGSGGERTFIRTIDIGRD